MTWSVVDFVFVTCLLPGGTERNIQETQSASRLRFEAGTSRIVIMRIIIIKIEEYDNINKPKA
jgi:hypothetical protein